MKKTIINLSSIALVLLLFSSCKSLSTNVTIKENKIPEKYASELSDSGNISEINWREYYADPLLVKLIDSALIGNFDLQMALQRIEIARANVKETKGALLPQAGINVNGGMRRYGLYTMDGAGNISTEITPGQIVPVNLPDINLGVYASWEVDIWGKLRNRRKSAAASYLASVEGKNFIVSNLVADVASAYYELIALDNELDIIRQTIQKQEEALEVIKLQKETGRTNELAVQQFQALLLNSKALEFETRQRITEWENLINFLLGRYPQPVERSKEMLFQEDLKQFSSGIPSQLLSNRPDIRESEYQVQASKFDLKAAKAAFFPNLNITGSLGFQAFNPEFLFMTPASIGYTALGSLIAPLVNLSALKAQFNTAKANQISAMYNYQKSILNGYVEVSNELSNIDNLKEINSFKKQQNEVLIQSVETSTELFKSAKANYLEVLLSQQNSLQTQLELINVSKRQKIASVKLYKALGGGWR